MKLSVVILNYNVRYFLELCLKSVQKAIENIEAEIIVVDNNSEDDSCNMVKALFPDVILIENHQNFGFSKGNNIGVSKAKGDYICILNPDTVVTEDLFEKFIELYKSKSNLGIAGCKLINGRGEFLPESKRNVPFVKAALKKFLGNSNEYYAVHLNENQTGNVDVLVGAFMFLNKQVFIDVGGFDEDYFMYGEDIDLSYKVLKAGYNNYYLGSSTIIHYKGESTLRDKLYVKRFYGAMQIFYKKHFKKNIAFNMLVWLGIKLVYLLKKQAIKSEKSIERYFLISNTKNVELQKLLKKELVLMLDLKDIIPKNTEIILDANGLSYKRIVDLMEKTSKNKKVTYKILPNNSNFIVGSDDAITRGEIINF
ncbi:MAG: glycosyltransferase family 2 protein [Flavobacteriales bacterium]|nr:glycosyltransferase family 2 protein [Flavobacteriia bacterium]NCP05048.1 glycosyltransferase family 2 protein [Flavobacteriales bacterium]PIV92584.1 MAG: glycosyl transferase family 2 [Flavobacteriaceae bacterium CG17_big_fil_post_rev_8_21_14_2_50_33_15]PIY12991.1 MAG: glycosyl transferase family 2 [Flavobacteriaceae bacterium CG_4_10_14_3_um_filter_33_47]PJB20101.1 MAG: glycosyl transferase family 2 [Flavobacteriaceae bacterium CG_4_9_14_3_um_filter_33_16]